MATPGEELPAAPMAARVPTGIQIAPEPHTVSARALTVASRLLAGATTFFFLAFLFAYFYLRSLDQDHMWRAAHVDPDQGLGVAFIACIVLSAALTVVAGRRLKAQSRDWILPASAGVVLALVAIALQCVEYTVQNFGPTNGGFASVFCGWTALYLIAVLFTTYWLETQVATELRARRAPAIGHADIEEPDRLIAPALDAAAFYWSFLAAIGVITYATLYLL